MLSTSLKAPVTSGAVLTLDINFGTVGGSTPAPIAIDTAPTARGPWRHISDITTDGGYEAVKLRPVLTSFYRFSYAGDADHTPTSLVFRVPVAATVSLRASTLNILSGRKVTLSGTVTPRATGIPLLVESASFDAHKWVVVARIRTMRNGAYRVAVKVPRGADYRVVARATSKNASGASPEVSINAGNTSDGHGGVMTCKKVNGTRICAGPGGFGVG